MRGVRVDAHAHVFRAVTEEYPRGANEMVPSDREANIEQLTAEMTAAEVDAAVLVPLDHHDRYVAEALAGEPHRFAAVGVAGAPVLGKTDDDPVEVLRIRRTLFPFHALRTSWLGDAERSMKESPFLPVVEALAEEGLPLWTYLPPDQLPLLEELVELVPDLAVVLNHMGCCPYDKRVDGHGRPWFPDPFPAPTLAALQRLAEAANVHVLFAGQYGFSREHPPYQDLDEVVGSLISWYGASRLLWGSDFPWIEEEPGYAATAELPRASLPQLSQADLAEVYGGTALRLFPHLAGHRAGAHARAVGAGT